MFDFDSWQEIWATITRNKVRSILTGFGVFWGILMLIILIGIGNGFKGGIEKSFGGFATNSCFFSADRTSEPYKGYKIGRYWRMSTSDLGLIRDKSQTVDLISPMIFGGGTAVRGMKTGNFGLRGVTESHFEVEKMSVIHGRVINELDVRDRRKVCVIGKEVYETLFNVGEDPIGQTIKARGKYFRVVGVIGQISNISIGGNVENAIFTPFPTMQLLFNRGDRIHMITCTAKPGYKASETEEEVKQILKAAHHISPTDEKAVRSFNIENEFERVKGLITGVDVLIWIVGLGALMSGVIGISNIMLVTVRERMREIGVRRAIGAKPMAILIQILSESFVLTAIAGIGGLVLGVGILSLIQMQMGDSSSGMFIPPFVSFNIALASVGILIVSGLIAGFMPAMRALKIKAIDAIRDE